MKRGIIQAVSLEEMIGNTYETGNELRMIGQRIQMYAGL